MDRNITNNPKLIGEPLGNIIPKKIKDKVKLVIVEAKVKKFENIEFKSLTSKLFYVDFDDDPKKVRENIMNDMDKKEIEIVLETLKKGTEKSVIFVRRKVSSELVKILFGTENPERYRIIIVHPIPLTKEGDNSGKLYLGVYGYENLIIK